MIVKSLEITKLEHGNLYRWVGGVYGVSTIGVASKITGGGKVTVGAMGWMNEEDPELIYIPLSWP